MRGINIYNETHNQIKYRKKHDLKCIFGSGFGPGTPSSLVRCSITEQSKSIPKDLQAEVPYSSPYKVFALKETTQTQVHPVRTY